MFVDTHAHLQWASFDADRKEVITRAIEESVNRVLNVGFDVEGSRKGILLAEQFDGLFAAVGFHPHSASQFTTRTSVMLRDMANNPKVLAIGEIGLDYYRNLSPKEVQRKAFEARAVCSRNWRPSGLFESHRGGCSQVAWLRTN